MPQSYPAHRPTELPWLPQVPAHQERWKVKYVAEINPNKSAWVSDAHEEMVTFLPMSSHMDFLTN